MEKKLNIGLVCDSYYPFVDGVSSVVDAYARNLSEYANVTVFTIKYNKKFDESNLPYKIVRCNSIKLPFFDYSIPFPWFDIKFSKKIKEANLDIVHLHSPYFVAHQALKYAKRNNIPVIITAHNQFKRLYFAATHGNRYLTRKLMNYTMKAFNNSDEVWACNEGMKQLFIEQYHLKAPCEVFNNATNMHPLKHKDMIDSLKEKHNIQSDERILLFVGRLIKIKNIDFIIDVYKALKDKGFKYKGIIIGDGEDKEHFVKKIHELGLNEQIVLTGSITDQHLLKSYYYMSDLFVFPSINDCSSIVQIEAACNYTPAIFADGAITSSTITKNKNGYLAPLNVDKFADEIINIFKDENEYQKIRQNAHDQIYVTWDMMIKNVYKRYQELIENKNESN